MSSSGLSSPSSAPPVPPDATIYPARNALYRKQVWWFVASFIALVAICQFLSWLLVKATSSIPSRRADAERRTPVQRTRRQWSRLPLAALNCFRVIAFRYTIGIGDTITLTYAEVFMTVVYIVAMLVWTFVNTTDAEGSMLTVQFWGTRAGSLAVSQFPLVTVLGTKNNILSYITGVSYDKLNFLHRMTARVVLMLLWIHGSSKFYALPPSWYGIWLVRLGIAMLTGFTLLAIIAFRPIRSRFYEAFFFTHFSMVLLILIGGYYHANQAAQLGVFICPCFYVWGADRILRLLRVFLFNNNLFGFSAGSKSKQGLIATAKLLSPKFVLLRVHRPPHLKWTPGQAAFLTVPGVARIPFEAHPFTIASVDSRYSLSSNTKPEAAQNDEKTGVNWEVLEFYINVREGFTKRLAEAAMGAGEGGMPVKVWVDGPYGFSPKLTDDDTVVLVAGGSGVSLAISMFLGVVSDVQTGKSRCRKLVLIWSIRNPEQLDWISSSLMTALNNCPPELEISIQIFHTGRSTESESKQILAHTDTYAYADTAGTSTRTSESPSKSKEKEIAMATIQVDSVESLVRSPRELRDLPAVRIATHRPNLHKLLKEEVDASAGGRLSVTVCGSAAIAKSCREALRLPVSSVLFGGPSVVLHVESFGYA